MPKLFVGCFSPIILLFLFIHLSKTALPPNHGLIPQNRNNPVMCTQNSLMIYYDCRICVCPKPNRPARCFRKTCDMRTKDSGQCPAAFLKMDDDQLCPKQRVIACINDNECPGQQLCCFDFCRGSQCLDPTALDFGMNRHQGRAYP